MLLDRLQKWVNKSRITKECQAGFREGHWTEDNVFNLSNIVNLKLWFFFKIFAKNLLK